LKLSPVLAQSQSRHKIRRRIHWLAGDARRRNSKYPPAKPEALVSEPLKAVIVSRLQAAFYAQNNSCWSNRRSSSSWSLMYF
jgi:hypothetical protein